MRRIIIPLLLVITATLSSCTYRGVVGSGRLETRDLDLSGYSRIEAQSAFQLKVVAGDSFSTVVTADDNVIDNIEATIVGDTLHLALRSGVSYSNLTLRGQITMPNLQGISLSDTSKALISGFQSAGSLEAEISGASTLDGDIQVGDAHLNGSGASRIQLTGTCTNLELHASGASQVDLTNLATTDADVVLSGASQATVNVSGVLDADLSGGSQLVYIGEPTLGNVRTTGAASLRQK